MLFVLFVSTRGQASAAGVKLGRKHLLSPGLAASASSAPAVASDVVVVVLVLLFAPPFHFRPIFFCP